MDEETGAYEMGGQLPIQVLADQLPNYLNRVRAEYAHQLLLAPPNFLTFRHPFG